MRVTTIANLKGGTGKSATAAFLAHALAGPLSSSSTRTRGWRR
jgi:cellulose biosynthesis protein BcsQ